MCNQEKSEHGLPNPGLCSPKSFPQTCPPEERQESQAAFDRGVRPECGRLREGAAEAWGRPNGEERARMFRCFSSSQRRAPQSPSGMLIVCLEAASIPACMRGHLLGGPSGPCANSRDFVQRVTQGHFWAKKCGRLPPDACSLLRGWAWGGRTKWGLLGGPAQPEIWPHRPSFFSTVKWRNSYRSSVGGCWVMHFGGSGFPFSFFIIIPY